MADKIFTEANSLELKKNYLLLAVKSDRAEFAEYLVNSGKIQAKEFNSNEMFACWIGTESARTVEILQNFGFDPHAKDDEGYTPLLSVLNGIRFYISWNDFNQYQHVKALLEAGANPEDTVTIEIKENNETKTVTRSALDLASGEEPIERLLRQAIEDRRKL